MNPGAKLRAVAAQALARIVAGESRRATFALASRQFGDSRDRALLAALLNEGARWWLRFAPAVDGLVERPIRDTEIQALLVVGLIQLEILHMPDYAAVAATVDAARALNKPKFAGLANALMRRWLRERDARLAALDSGVVTASAHPRWLIDALRADHGAASDSMLAANNVEAPLWLRVNRRRATREELAAAFTEAEIGFEISTESPDAIRLQESRDVTTLPGFDDGTFSVQDGAAQHAAVLLDVRDGVRVLDACAAPGGKTAHILERADAHVIALDRDASRLQRVGENLDRLGIRCQLQTGDAADPKIWWDRQSFDRILLDMPCSATGIIRRQPDIKLHRRDTDIAPLVATQKRILDAMWPLLKPGGRLVYATCSVLAAENARQIDTFLARHADAAALPVPLTWHPAGVGVQNLPGEGGMDGFFYAIVEKYN